MRKPKGLNTAIAVVVTIVVLLIIALAVIGVSTGAIGKLGDTISNTPGGDDLSSTVCESQVTEASCKINPTCEWTGKKCVPKE